MTQTALAKDSKGHARPGGGSGGTSGEPAHPLEGLLDAVGNRGMQAIAATAGVPSPPAISRSVSSGTLQRVCAGGSDESTECGQQTHSLPWVQRNASDGAGTPSMSRSLAASG